jgi:uncharacterized protein YjbI with pentapeptide repeats
LINPYRTTARYAGSDWSRLSSGGLPNEESPLDLRGVYLAGIQLPAESNLNNAILDYADLSYSQMSSVDLGSSSIKHTQFFQTCLIGANLSGARHTDFVNFERAIPSSADLRGSVTTAQTYATPSWVTLK